ncbi:MAG: DegT/DnrJ/EryC1/StrS family aminotransferase [Phycisphaerales bacterium]|nr:MAG: DegT/DnrJ/EryC1/StrS family aminotransferase [Phycisphaerales bacterium]
MIPVNEPLLGERELQYTHECIRSGWISSTGRFVEEFENSWAAYCGRRHGVAVCNGTAALQLAVAGLELQPGDEVIMPAFTIISCATAVLAVGAVPVLVDCDPRTWTMDVDQVADRITPRTRAVMPVHIYGHPVDLDPILALAQEHDLAVIEDAAEAHGAEYLCGRARGDGTWRRCGGFGTASCFSFYANKIVTTGEGGMVLTNDAALARRYHALRNLCFGTESRFRHEGLGFNFRMTNLQAAVGVAQVERIAETLERKRWMGREYTRRLRDVPHLQVPVEEPWARNVYWMYGVLIGSEVGASAGQVAAVMREKGVDTRPFFLGLHEQPALVQRGLFHEERYPVTERLSRQGLYLPSSATLTEDQSRHVGEVLREVVS